MRIVKKLLKFLLYAVLLLIAILGIGYLVLNEKLPEGQAGVEADQLAEEILEAVNHEAWKKLPMIEWDFPRGHHFFWDKERHFVEVFWDDAPFNEPSQPA